jgi:hypothetical protein
MAVIPLIAIIKIEKIPANRNLREWNNFISIPLLLIA